MILRLQRGERIVVERGVPRLAFGDGTLDALCIDSVSSGPSAKAWVRFVEVGPLPGGKRSGAGDVVGSAARHEDGLSAISIPGPTTLDGGWQVLFNFWFGCLIFEAGDSTGPPAFLFRLIGARERQGEIPFSFVLFHIWKFLFHFMGAGADRRGIQLHAKRAKIATYPIAQPAPRRIALNSSMISIGYACQ